MNRNRSRIYASLIKSKVIDFTLKVIWLLPFSLSVYRCLLSNSLCRHEHYDCLYTHHFRRLQVRFSSSMKLARLLFWPGGGGACGARDEEHDFELTPPPIKYRFSRPFSSPLHSISSIFNSISSAEAFCVQILSSISSNSHSYSFFVNRVKKTKQIRQLSLKSSLSLSELGGS